MKNRDMNTIVRTACMLDQNPCFKGASVSPEAVWAPDLTSQSTPPPHFTNDKYLQVIFTDSAKPARHFVRWHPTRVVFVVLLSAVTLTLFPILLFAPRVATFWGNEI